MPNRRRANGKALGLSRGQAQMHFRDDGQPKRGYDTSAEAWDVLRLRSLDPGYDRGPWRLYRCDVCAEIHIGHESAQQRKVRVGVRFMEEWSSEVGRRAAAHLLAENGTHSPWQRCVTIERRAISALRRSVRTTII